MTALLARLALGPDRDAAFAGLYAFYAPRIRTYLRRLGADPAVAEGPHPGGDGDSLGARRRSTIRRALRRGPGSSPSRETCASMRRAASGGRNPIPGIRRWRPTRPNRRRRS